MVTSLYFTIVLPASTPDTELNTIVIVGPSSRMRWIAMPIATAAVRIGMIQTIEIRTRRFGTTLAAGRSSGSGCSAIMTLRGGIPDEARVEGLGGDHRQHHHRRKEDHPRPGLDRHQRLELHEGDGERVD